MFNADISNAYYTWYQIEIFEANIYTTSTTFFAVKSSTFHNGDLQQTTKTKLAYIYTLSTDIVINIP